MNKIIKFEDAQKRYEEIQINRIKEDNDYMGKVLTNIIGYTITPMNILGIDELTIDSTGTIVKSKVNKKSCKGLTIHSYEPPEGDE